MIAGKPAKKLTVRVRVDASAFRGALARIQQQCDALAFTLRQETRQAQEARGVVERAFDAERERARIRERRWRLLVAAAFFLGFVVGGWVGWAL